MSVEPIKIGPMYRIAWWQRVFTNTIHTHIYFFPSGHIAFQTQSPRIFIPALSYTADNQNTESITLRLVLILRDRSDPISEVN